MNPFERLRTKEVRASINNPHLWAIVIIVVIIILFYYVGTFPYYKRLPWLTEIGLFEFRNRMTGTFFLIPFMYATVVFWWKGALAVWLLSLVAVLPRMLHLSMTSAALLTNLAFAFIPFAVVMFINLESKWREKERGMLRAREAEQRVYMLNIFKAQEAERQRIAQELHDDTLQTLLIAANRAQSLVSNDCIKGLQEIEEQVEWLRDTAIEVANDIRRLSVDLRPSILDSMGLVPALRWLADRLSQETGIDAKVSVKGEIRSLGEDDTTIFRIVQEALNNVRRHSKATLARVSLEFALGSLKIAVRDNGAGFSLPAQISDFATRGKLGLVGLQQRAEFINGTFNVYSEVGKGTTVSVELSCLPSVIERLEDP